ncbi:SAM-dependent methyltransferase [Kitasatospora sp. NE20-6]|uniref:SAM-dependent methyltransferase n=1 Tax=Kitasatospora sp. NE20-6 TaxID=2859066 RepID=UPI0038B2EA25
MTRPGKTRPEAVRRPAGHAPAPRSAGVVQIEEPLREAVALAEPWNSPWDRPWPPQAAAAQLRTDVAASARVTSVVLGGKDHVGIDRDVAHRLLEADSDWAQTAESARWAVLGMAAAVASLGVGQFVDLGCGLATGAPGSALAPLHTAVLAARPDAHILYADQDPMVLAHARALLRVPAPASVGHLPVDLTDPAALLAALREETNLEWSTLVAAVLSDVLHELTDTQAHRLLATLHESLPPGSVLLLTHRAPGTGGSAVALADTHTEAALAWHPRNDEQVADLTSAWQPLPQVGPVRCAGFTTAVLTNRRPA